MKAQQILIAGPYRSGTDGIAERIEANLAALLQAAFEVYRLGHMPLIGEWITLPLAACAGSFSADADLSTDALHPVTARLLAHCAAVLRIGGASPGADEDVQLAQRQGLTVYRGVEEIPRAG